MRKSVILVIGAFSLAGSGIVTPALSDSVMDGAARAKPNVAGAFSYQGYAGGFRIGNVDMNVALLDGRYAAKMSLETSGMVGWFVEWRHGSTASGSALPVDRPTGGASPLSIAHYHNDSFWKGRDRYVTVAVNNRVAAVTKADPHPVKDEQRPLITEAQRTDVLDPLSAIIAIGRTLELTGSCTAELPVFDGRRRYTLKVEDQGLAKLEKSRSAPYEADAQRCRFVFERVSGFRKQKSDDEPTNGRAYYRRVAPNAPMMPVKIVAELDYGSAIINLKRYKALDPAKAAAALAMPSKR